MKVSVYNQHGQVVGDVELSDALFAVVPDQHLIAEAARIQMSNSRVGLAHTKTRGNVKGGGKKPWKQKGTGRARAGSIRSPLWRHGGVTFGPQSDRNWERKLNKKAKVKALAMSLTDKVAEKHLYVVDTITLTENKTKLVQAMLQEFGKNVGGLGKKQLLVASTGNKGVVRAARNLPYCTTISASTLNILEILKADDVIITKESLPVLAKTFVRTQK
ncbi:MAG: 50S ribosomal protein L4 [Candidatus Doudnabacteria bacterium]|nr:50S ribosomal protein L4 [Candidatus Doudnabacteria bacterium]